MVEVELGRGGVGQSFALSHRPPRLNFAAKSRLGMRGVEFESCPSSFYPNTQRFCSPLMACGNHCSLCMKNLDVTVRLLNLVYTFAHLQSVLFSGVMEVANLPNSIPERSISSINNLDTGWFTQCRMSDDDVCKQSYQTLLRPKIISYEHKPRSHHSFMKVFDT